MVDKVDEILRELKHNVEGTKKVLKQWEENLLFERKARPRPVGVDRLPAAADAHHCPRL
jgi:hypothetical protein